jgi:hypothetical protein
VLSDASKSNNTTLPVCYIGLLCCN